MADKKIAELTDYLHANIPLSGAMAVGVRAASRDAVTLEAPLGPNINHKSTVFGGSLSALAVLSAWSLVHLRLKEDGIANEIVIQSSEMAFERPAAGAFTATSAFGKTADWQGFVTILRRRGRARIDMTAEVECGGETVARMKGRFVALATKKDVP